MIGAGHTSSTLVLAYTEAVVPIPARATQNISLHPANIFLPVEVLQRYFFGWKISFFVEIILLTLDLNRKKFFESNFS